MIRTAVEVVESSVRYGYERPMTNDFYIWFAGMIHVEFPMDEDFLWDTIKKIDSKEWQYAKKLVFGGLFNFDKED